MNSPPTSRIDYAPVLRLRKHRDDPFARRSRRHIEPTQDALRAHRPALCVPSRRPDRDICSKISTFPVLHIEAALARMGRLRKPRGNAQLLAPSLHLPLRRPERRITSVLPYLIFIKRIDRRRLPLKVRHADPRLLVLVLLQDCRPALDDYQQVM
jgi:hypothetical protein